MHKEVDPSDADLLCNYKFDAADGTSLADNTANSNVGTLYNMLDEDWQIATDPCGAYGTSVRTDNPTSTEAIGKTITVDISSSVDTSNCLGIYTWGDGDTPISGETYPAGITQRINLVWGIEEYGDDTADVVFDYSGVNGITDASALKLLKRTSADTAWIDITSSAVHNTTNHTFSMSGLTSFSEFSISDDGTNPLPVELIDFSTKSVEGQTVLTWSTATEVNNYGFEIVRLRPKNRDSGATNWETISFIEGHGNSNSRNDYSFIDREKLAGVIKYRLKQIDTDGAYVYSKVVEVNVELPKIYELRQNFPNPFNPTTTINYELPYDSKITLEIYNVVGERVEVITNKIESAGFHSVIWNADDFASGIYLIRLNAESVTNNIIYSKVIKAALLK